MVVYYRECLCCPICGTEVIIDWREGGEIDSLDELEEGVSPEDYIIQDDYYFPDINYNDCPHIAANMAWGLDEKPNINESLQEPIIAYHESQKDPDDESIELDSIEEIEDFVLDLFLDTDDDFEFQSDDGKLKLYFTSLFVNKHDGPNGGGSTDYYLFATKAD
jgi:hypothetical protein